MSSQLKLMLVCIGSLVFSSAWATDLVQSYQNALTYNADYLAAISTNKATSENQRQALASLLPQISANGTIREVYSYTQFELFFHQPTLGASLQQSLLDFNKFSNYSKQKYGTALGNLILLDAKQSLMLNTVKSYFDVLYASDILRDTEIAESSLSVQYQQAQKSFTAGIVNIADVNDSKAGYYAALANVIQGQNDVENKKLIYRNITGLEAQNILPLKKDINVTGTSLNIESYVDAGINNSNAVKIAGLQLKMAAEDIKIAKANHYPNLVLVANYQYQGDANLDGGNESATRFFNAQRQLGVQGHNQNGYVGLQLNVPIYSGGLVSSQARVAIDNYEVAFQKLLAAKRQVRENIQTTGLQVKTGLNLLTAQKEALFAAKLKLKSDRIGYKAGIRTSLDVVNAQLDYVKAIQNYNNARYNYLNAKLQLEYLAGKLNINYLKNLNANIAQ